MKLSRRAFLAAAAALLAPPAPCCCGVSIDFSIDGGSTWRPIYLLPTCEPSPDAGRIKCDFGQWRITRIEC